MPGTFVALLVCPLMLGAPEYADREWAEARLRKAGLLAVPALIAYESDQCPEVRNRAQRLTAGHRAYLREVAACRKWLNSPEWIAAPLLAAEAGDFDRDRVALARAFRGAGLICRVECADIEAGGYTCPHVPGAYSYGPHAAMDWLFIIRQRALTGSRWPRWAD